MHLKGDPWLLFLAMQATWSSGRAFTDALSLGEDPEAMAKFADVLLKRVVKKKAEATKEEL